MLSSAQSKPLHEAWCQRHISKKLGVPLAHTPYLQHSSARLRSDKLKAALTRPDPNVSAGMICELLDEARLYVKTTHSIITQNPGAPSSHVRRWAKDVPPAMRIKIEPLCNAAAVIGGEGAGSWFRGSYEALETDFKRRGRAASKDGRLRVAGCAGPFDDFKQGVEQWCADYESWMLSITDPSYFPTWAAGYDDTFPSAWPIGGTSQGGAPCDFLHEWLGRLAVAINGFLRAQNNRKGVKKALENLKYRSEQASQIRHYFPNQPQYAMDRFDRLAAIAAALVHTHERKELPSLLSRMPVNSPDFWKHMLAAGMPSASAGPTQVSVSV